MSPLSIASEANPVFEIRRVASFLDFLGPHQFDYPLLFAPYLRKRNSPVPEQVIHGSGHTLTEPEVCQKPRVGLVTITL